MVHNGVMMHYNVNYVQQYTVQRSLWNFQCFLMNIHLDDSETGVFDLSTSVLILYRSFLQMMVLGPPWNTLT